MKRINFLKLSLPLIVTFITFVTISCGTSKETTENDPGDLGSFKVEKSGAVLWGENCGRCHNAPDPTAFSDLQWEAIGTHMRIRAGITTEETQKIVTFLKQSN